MFIAQSMYLYEKDNGGGGKSNVKQMPSTLPKRFFVKKGFY